MSLELNQSTPGIKVYTASVLIQAATNMFNEYYDFKRGLDTAESVGIAGAITNDGVKANTVLYLALSLPGNCRAFRCLYLYQQQLVAGIDWRRMYGCRISLHRWPVSDRLHFSG
ncbi:MAG: 1,4-dihydroxy-2-naphthoate octaprenyltransferase [Desulfotomaculum sp. 46_296]|nr:MAG: 1,4-dihydroxy-2-naphthoate octaprenyltransferase [Desulfotomaculum sp. 46_296]